MMLLVAPKLNLNGNWKPVCQRLFNSQRKNAVENKSWTNGF